MNNLGYNHEAEIEKICKDINKLIMKADHTPAEVDAIHDYAEVIYYLTTTDAMNKATMEGMSMASMNGGSMRMMPSYGRSMDHEYSMDGRRGRDGDGDGRYSERRFPRDTYDRESERYYGRY